ncbi:hypothetical protein RB3456 [Rhodopirellula baltica SH 1]|uniref:Uncharacterized protein n=1 Tax=Rhodopirellula baltica (strain DSM 10527 / NCIMB 13988 / SH1) TaxID=243090 RepID=Q7UU77_RHOBA|nr:hypothetical protein RB3456 [Rhodopirellula baltica SH 1]
MHRRNRANSNRTALTVSDIKTDDISGRCSRRAASSGGGLAETPSRFLCAHRTFSRFRLSNIAACADLKLLRPFSAKRQENRNPAHSEHLSQTACLSASAGRLFTARTADTQIAT